MTQPDLSFTIREIRTAHLAFPDTPGYWEQYRRQNEAGSKRDARSRPVRVQTRMANRLRHHGRDAR